MNCLYGYPSITCSVLISAKVIEKMDEWFDPAYDLGEDTDFFLRLMLSGARFAWLKEILSDYRYSHEYSSTIYLDIHRSRRQLLTKIFQMTNLPSEIAQQQQQVMINNDLGSAWMAYAGRLEKTAQYFLLLALIREPRLANDLSHIVLEGLTSYVRNKTVVDDPDQYLDHVMHHLPAPLKHLAAWEKEVKENISGKNNDSFVQLQE